MAGTLGKTFDNFPAGPARYGYFYDYHSDEDITEGVFTAISSGTNSVLDTGPGGLMRISGAATTDDSGGEWQVDSASIVLPVSKTVRMLSRHIISDATQSDFRVGLATLDTSIIASAPTNAVMVSKTDGAATLDFIVIVGGVTTYSQASIATIADATAFELAIEVVVSATSGTADSVRVWFNGTSVVNARAVSVPLATSLMSGVIAFQSGDNVGTKTCDTDYFGVEVGR